MISKSYLNNKVINNFIRIKLTYYYLLPLLVVVTCLSLPLVFSSNTSFEEGYISIQKRLFFSINAYLSTYPYFFYNLTQLGDVIILFPFVAILVLYAPKFWEALITSSLLSLIVSAILKKTFSIPRPAAVFDNDTFIIVGKTLKGNSSLPSGHSMTTFIIITLLILAFMPNKKIQKLFWILFMLIVGLLITLSRVGVGAHYTLDVFVGSSIGFILAISGIQINKKLNWGSKMNFKFNSIVLLIFQVIWVGLVIQKIVTLDITITYLALIPLFITIYLTSKRYVQNKS